MDITFVTSLYDLSKIEPHRRPLSDYLEKGKVWANKKINMVVFTSPELADPSLYPANAVIIIKSFDSFPDHALMTPAVKAVIPPHPKDTPNYFVLMSSKFYCLQEAMQLDPFKTNYFAWLDYGISHVANVDKIESLDLTMLSSQKIKLTNFCPITHKDRLPPTPGYHSHVEARVACGMMVGMKDRMRQFCREFQETNATWLSQGIVGLEGWVVSKMVAMGMEKYQLYPGDYAQIISNFNQVTDNIPHCLYLAETYLKNYAYSLSIDLYLHFYDYSCPPPPFPPHGESHQEMAFPMRRGWRKPPSLPPAQLYSLYLNLFQASFWIDPLFAYEVAKEMVSLALMIPELQRMMEDNFTLVNNYFNLLPLPQKPPALVKITHPENVVKAINHALQLVNSHNVTVMMKEVGEKDLRQLKVVNPRYLPYSSSL